MTDIAKATPILDECPCFCHVLSTVTATWAIIFPSLSLSYLIFSGSSSNITYFNLLAGSFTMVSVCFSDCLLRSCNLLSNGYFVSGAGKSKIAQYFFSLAWRMGIAAYKYCSYSHFIRFLVFDFDKLVALLILNDVKVFLQFSP